MSAVEVRGLGVRVGDATLLSDVELSVEPGTWCTIVGPNGAGKTTLVETVAGLRRPTRGTVTVGGCDIHSLTERRRALRLSLVAQHPVVPPGMSVADFVALGRTAHHGVLRAPNARDREAVAGVLDRLDLAALAPRDVATLSGGERQRAVLARALVQSTPVVVLDEPTAGLDLRHQVELLALLRREVSEGGLAVVATLHDLSLASQFADRLVLLDHGRVVLDDRPRDVLRSDELSRCYGLAFRVVDVDGTDIVVPVIPSVTPA